MGEQTTNKQNNDNDLNYVLENKLRAYADFLAATALLKNAFEAEDMVKVEQFTQQRENIINYVNGLDNQIKRSHRDNGGGEKRSVITEALNKILQRMIEANRNCEAIATLKCDLAKRELATVHHKEKVISGYANKTRGIPKFLDVRT